MKRLILIFAAMLLINGCICSGWEVNDRWKGTIIDPQRWEREKRVSKAEGREMSDMIGDIQALHDEAERKEKQDEADTVPACEKDDDYWRAHARGQREAYAEVLKRMRRSKR